MIASVQFTNMFKTHRPLTRDSNAQGKEFDKMFEEMFLEQPDWERHGIPPVTMHMYLLKGISRSSMDDSLYFSIIIIFLREFHNLLPASCGIYFPLAATVLHYYFVSWLKQSETKPKEIFHLVCYAPPVESQTAMSEGCCGEHHRWKNVIPNALPLPLCNYAELLISSIPHAKRKGYGGMDGLSDGCDLMRCMTNELKKDCL